MHSSEQEEIKNCLIYGVINTYKYISNFYIVLF